MAAPDHLALSRGEVTRFAKQCEMFLAELKPAKEEDPQPTVEDVHRTAARITWAWYYVTKSAPPEEADRLLAQYQQALELLHDIFLRVEKVRLVQEKVVKVPVPSYIQPAIEPVPTLPRDPEQAEIVLSPEEV